MNRTETPTGSPWLFFLLTFALVLPFYGMGLLTDRGFLAGLRVKLPVSALAFVCPIGAALILTIREGRGAAKAFLGRVFSLRGVRSWVWIAAAVLLLPVLYLVSYAIQRGLGIPLPTPQVSPVTIGVFVVLFFVALRTLIVWIYNNTGRTMLAAVVVHGL
jgi:hypothetical protein